MSAFQHPGLARAAGLLLAMSVPSWASDCLPQGSSSVATARGLVDARTIQMNDGTVLWLAGLDVPHDDKALTALQVLIAGQNLRWRTVGSAPDRYGRWPAIVAPEGSPSTLQEALLRTGHARIATRILRDGCLEAFRQGERIARDSRLGLWADEAFGIKPAERPADILALRGQLSVVEGRVVSVREAGSTIYVNFGRRWTEDFTASTLKRHEKSFAAAGVDLKGLSGRMVRIRGVVEERGGPWIELLRPEQIEVVRP